MKKTLLLLLVTMICSISAFTQNCAPDSTLPDDFIGISPLSDSQEPCDTLVPSDIAFLDETTVEYETIITVFIPAEVSGVALNSVSLNTAASADPGITGLPMGLTYDCEPGDCIFPAGVAGCVRIHGFVDQSVQPDIYDLLITANVDAGLLSGDVRFPLPDDPDDLTTVESVLGSFGFTFPECPYQIRVDATNSNQSLFESKVSLSQNTPNPFTGVTNIAVNAEAGDYTFAVFNTLGEMVHSREIRINGNDNIEYDGSNLDAGIYFYSLSNDEGKLTRRMIVR